MKGNLETRVDNIKPDVVCAHSKTPSVFGAPQIDDDLCVFAELVKYKAKVYRCQYKKDCMYQSHYGHSVSYCEKELNRND